MSVKFLNIDRNTPMLFPVDLCDWLPENSLVPFAINAVDTQDLQGFTSKYTRKWKFPVSTVNDAGTADLLLCDRKIFFKRN